MISWFQVVRMLTINARMHAKVVRRKYFADFTSVSDAPSAIPLFKSGARFTNPSGENTVTF